VIVVIARRLSEASPVNLPTLAKPLSDYPGAV
jgi:hypothetical protein